MDKDCSLVLGCLVIVIVTWCVSATIIGCEREKTKQIELSLEIAKLQAQKNIH